MNNCKVFRRAKNSHEEFCGIIFERDDGAVMFELRHREKDGHGNFRDGKFPLLRCGVERSLPIIAEIIREALTKGGAR